VQEYFIAVDGDNVGSHLEYFAITNNVEALKAFSQKFNSAMDWFEKELVNSFDVKVVFYGGDNLLASVSLDKFEKEILEKLRFEFFKRSDSTLSIGLGESPQQAYLALKLAKTNGKNAIREFSELSHG
jgi:GTP cyclohydrolase III